MQRFCHHLENMEIVCEKSKHRHVVHVQLTQVAPKYKQTADIMSTKIRDTSNWTWITYQVREWNKLGEDRAYMCTARPNWLSLSTKFFKKEACHRVPIPLYDILDLNEAKMTVRVEPMVSVGDITRYLIPKGYTLAVTLEIADATLGGLAMGVGMTTYSHKVHFQQFPNIFSNIFFS